VADVAAPPLERTILECAGRPAKLGFSFDLMPGFRIDGLRALF
jgi:hypothetical protein